MSRITTDQILQIARPASDGIRAPLEGAERFDNHLQRATGAAEREHAGQLTTPRNEVRAVEYDDVEGDSDTTPSDDPGTNSSPEPTEPGDTPTEQPVDPETPPSGDEVTISGEPDDEIVGAIVYTQSGPVEVASLPGETELPPVSEVAAEPVEGEKGSDASQQGTPNTTLEGELADEIDSAGEAESADRDGPLVVRSTKDEPTNRSEGSPDDANASNVRKDAGQNVSSTDERIPSIGEKNGTVGSRADGSPIDQETAVGNAPSTDSQESAPNPARGEARVERRDNPASREQTADVAANGDAEEAPAAKPSTENVARAAESQTKATPSANNIADAANGSERLLTRTAAGSNASNVDAQAEADSTPTVDRARFVQRVSGALRSAQQRDGQIQLRLSPPELGSLRITIEVKQGVVTATLETETAAARNVLLDNLPALRERLAEQEIRIDKFDVDVGRDGQQRDKHGAQDRQPDRPQPSRPLRADDSPEQNIAPTTAALPPSPHQGALDVRI